MASAPVVTIYFDRCVTGTVALSSDRKDFVYTGNVEAMKGIIDSLHRSAIREHLPRELFLERLPSMLSGRRWAEIEQ